MRDLSRISHTVLTRPADRRDVGRSGEDEHENALMGGTRVAYRAWKEGHLSRIASEGRRVIILGAGSAAANLLHNIGRSAEWRFVGLLDDDPVKLNREIHGFRVLGTLGELPTIAAEHEIELAVIAMPACRFRSRSTR